MSCYCWIRVKEIRDNVFTTCGYFSTTNFLERFLQGTAYCGYVTSRAKIKIYRLPKIFALFNKRIHMRPWVGINIEMPPKNPANSIANKPSDTERPIVNLQ